jgi:protein O-GlcNAc transferase
MDSVRGVKEVSRVSTAKVLHTALLRHRAGKLHEAEQLYRAVLAKKPRHPEASFLLGVIAIASGRLDLAFNLLARATASASGNSALQADLAEASFNLGLAFEGQGDLDRAIACFERAVELKPDAPQMHRRLARALRIRCDFVRAIAHYERALALAPAAAEIASDLGGTLKLAGHLDQAIAVYRRAIEIQPRFAPTHSNLGVALMDQLRLDDAMASFRRALDLDPDLVSAHCNLGNALTYSGLMDEAIASFRRAIAKRPDHHVAHSNLVYALAFHPAYDAGGILEEARAWSRQHAPSLAGAEPHPNDRSPERRLRIGYVSPDFRDHCQALFMTPLLRHHDHENFEIACYSSVATPDAVTQRLRDHTDLWRSIAGVDDAAAERIVRDDRIDVLVDLTMHMSNTRLRLFARKPAPLQVCWLAYPGTTGLDAIDYRITDPWLDPQEGDDSVYAERSVRLADAFWCYDPLAAEPAAAPLPALSGGGVTFGCLNNFSKVHEGVIELWARVLREASGSRLLLLAPLGSARQRTLEAFAKNGVEGDRVVFVERRPRSEYLALHGQIDVCLDTFPVNGHTTSLDAFWMGVPVVTLVGKTVIGRGGLSQAMNLGLPELVAWTPDEYVRIAVDLSRDLDRLSALRASLRSRMEKSPLMDGPRFALNLETAYRGMWREWCGWLGVAAERSPGMGA